MTIIIIIEPLGFSHWVVGYKYNRTNIKYVIVNGYLKCKMLFYYLSVGFYGVLLTLSNANRLHNRCPNTNMAKMYIQHSRFFFANTRRSKRLGMKGSTEFKNSKFWFKTAWKRLNCSSAIIISVNLFTISIICIQ